MAVRKRKKKAAKPQVIDPVAFVAETFGKELCLPLDKLPEACHWYAWKGAIEDAYLFFDTRKFEGYPRVSELTLMPDGATGAVVFW